MNLPQLSLSNMGSSRRNSKLLALMISVAIAIAFSCTEAPYEFSGAVSDPPQVIGDFVLTDQYGDAFTMSSDANDVSIVFFGYTLCPDVCPTTLADMIKAKRALGEDAERVSFIWVTVDPERDTPGVLKQRIEVFDPEFIGLSGSRETLTKVWDDFGIFVERDDSQNSAAGYLVSHTANLYLVDNMRSKVVFPFGTHSDSIAADIKAVLNSQEEN